jgi:hypothetical protein
MHFHVARTAVIEPWAAQIVERRRHSADRIRRNTRTAHIGVALEADESFLVALQHAWVRRSMRLMASSATFQFHRRMFKCERPALVAVALETTGLIAIHRLQHLESRSAMRIVAIGARHGAFGDRMMMRAIEFGDYARMALLAELRRLLIL